MRRLTVPLADRSYDVVVGRGVVAELATLLPSTAKRAAVVTQDGIPAEIELPGVEITTFIIGQGESAKTLDTIATLMSGFAAMGLPRHDVVISVGGGMVTDIAGFAAASESNRGEG